MRRSYSKHDSLENLEISLKKYSFIFCFVERVSFIIFLFLLKVVANKGNKDCWFTKKEVGEHVRKITNFGFSIFFNFCFPFSAFFCRLAYFLGMPSVFCSFLPFYLKRQKKAEKWRKQNSIYIKFLLYSSFKKWKKKKWNAIPFS